MSPCIVVKDEGWWPWELSPPRWGLMPWELLLYHDEGLCPGSLLQMMRVDGPESFALTRWGLMPWELLL